MSPGLQRRTMGRPERTALHPYPGGPPVGFFKQMKDMKNMVHEAPEMVAMATEMGANAQAAAAAQQAAADQALAAAQAGAAMPTVAQPGAAGADPSGDFSPINGVGLELYADISRSFAE